MRAESALAQNTTLPPPVPPRSKTGLLAALGLAATLAIGGGWYTIAPKLVVDAQQGQRAKQDADRAALEKSEAEEAFKKGKAAFGDEDYIEAALLFRKAADVGHASAQKSLGDMYHEGQGVAEDDARAMMWYRKAADQGNANAQTSIGDLYHNGDGVAKDDAQAMTWYRKAADQGDAAAQIGVGDLYHEGEGVGEG